MRRLIAVGVLLLLIALICATGVLYTISVCDELETMLEACVDCYQQDDMSGAAETARRLEDYWVGVEERLSVFVNHSELDDIGTSIARLEPYANAGDRALYLGECKLAKTMLLHIRGDEGFCWHSIF